MSIGERLNSIQTDDSISTQVIEILRTLNDSFEKVCVPESQRTTFHHINHIVRQFAGRLDNMIKTNAISFEEGIAYLEWMNYFMCEIFPDEYQAINFKNIFVNIKGINYPVLEQ